MSYKLERVELDALLEVLKNTRCETSTYLWQTRPLLLIQNGQRRVKTFSEHNDESFFSRYYNQLLPFYHEHCHIEYCDVSKILQMNPERGSSHCKLKCVRI